MQFLEVILVFLETLGEQIILLESCGGSKSNFGKGICGWLGVFLIKVIGLGPLGLRLLKWVGLCIELGLCPNRLD